MTENTIKIAVIGGTGLSELEGASSRRTHAISTDFGEPSAAIEELGFEVDSRQVGFYFLPRHGNPHRIAPHRINYRANIAALQALGVTQIIAVNAVGGIDPRLKPEDIVAPSQVIDYTHGRETSFFDGIIRPLEHHDFSDPLSDSLLQCISKAAASTGIAVVEGGTYGVTQGPRLETAAEIRRMAQDGATVVGMTLMPEAILAREVHLAYATLCLVVNPAAGVSPEVITMDEIHLAVKNGMGKVKQLVKQLIIDLSAGQL